MSSLEQIEGKREDDLEYSVHFIAGWFGGVAGLLAGHPSDTIKARLQTDGLEGARVYRGTIHCIRHMVVKEGVLSLYKGMASPLLGMAIINATVFGVQGNMMRGRSDTIWNHSVAGGVAGIAQCFLCSPMELVKLRMQMQTNPTEMFHWTTSANNGRVYSDPWDATKKIIRQHGLRGYFKGLELTLLREVPSFSAYFATYEYLCRRFARYSGTGTVTTDDLSPLALCLAGGISGVVAWVLSYPVDVVKSRVQVDGMFGHRTYCSIWDCVVKSSREPEGLLVFWKGLNSAVIRGFIFNAAALPTVSLLLRYWKRRQS